MATRTRRAPLTAAEREARREAERQLLAQAVEELKSSEGWMRWLKVRRAFHAYSMTNQLLIALQRPDATMVAGFAKWLALGRCVRKGEKGIRIFAPVPPSKKALTAWRDAGADPRTKPRTHFKLTAVFDLAQVDPLPAPADVVELAPPFDLSVAGDELAELLQPDGPLTRLAGELGVTVEFVERDGGGSTHGWFNSRTCTICVYADATANSQAATTVHELAHALVRLDRLQDDPVLDYAREELVVESVAYAVLASLGIDAGTSSIPYLASWSESVPLSTIEVHAKLIDRLARRIEQAIDTNGPGDRGGSDDGEAR